LLGQFCYPSVYPCSLQCFPSLCIVLLTKTSCKFFFTLACVLHASRILAPLVR
jgi:hypothetical protein